MTDNNELRREADATASKPYERPMNGAEYLESLRDGRRSTSTASG